MTGGEVWERERERGGGQTCVKSHYVDGVNIVAL